MKENLQKNLIERLESSLITMLESHYGDSRKWETNHFKHYRQYITCMVTQVKEMTDEDFLGNPEHHRLRLGIEITESLALAIDDSDIHPNAKKMLFEILHERAINFEEELIKKRFHKGRGKPQQTYIQNFICYLHEHLGSYEKAVAYTLDTPYIYKDQKRPDFETLLRENRKYRNTHN
ncbi:hypothetical protein [Hydrogenovibrio marinus]|uniref:Uncharacterized protein n=1 Tax=Hydrogenovibrio marinus TaxID=28885 RepID=A0A066ZXN4_HYDMR|nr:hypothetical protein [Hydrogenovibrio marinus]KDN94870.1 hypothetical protein EI16_00710 [Hydrogenovibrio marinus]BBN59335.1 hypothetical protein HVMH_0929 [Hydrogenovibrio marinus]